MPTWSPGDIRAVLKAKGFREVRPSDHENYRLFVGSKATSIRTRVSHGGKGDVARDSQLFTCYKRQLRLSASELTDFFSCPMSGEDYLAVLVMQGAIDLK